MESLPRSITIVILSPEDVAFPSDLLSDIQSALVFMEYFILPSPSKQERNIVLLVSNSPKFNTSGVTIKALLIFFSIISRGALLPESIVISFLFVSYPNLANSME